MLIRTAVLCTLAAICATAQTLWKEPPAHPASYWLWGPGGEELAPRPPFRFIKERFSGSNPKVEVKDAAGRRWVVKFGSEVHTDVFLSRFVGALGYASEPVFRVRQGTIEEVRGLKRAKHFIASDGSFVEGRFKLHASKDAKEARDSTEREEPGDKGWSWADNPFKGTRELGGLKVMVMLTSNWDTKDSRNQKAGSNTGTIRPFEAPDNEDWYAVTDWGATLGRAGGLFKRNRWDWAGYRSETPKFVRVGSDGKLRWRYKGRHERDITGDVTVDDVRWILRYLSPITNNDMEAGLAASGASEAVAREYTQLIRSRIDQLEAVAAK